MLMGDRSRYLTLLIGLAGVSFLFVQQGSVLSGVILRIAKPVDAVGAPIWVCDPQLQSIDDSKPLLDIDLYRVRSVPGVQWAVPLFLRTVQARLADGRFQVVRLFGLDDDTLIGRPPEMLTGSTSDLFTPDAVIIGKAESERLGNPQIGDTFEFNDHRARVVGIASVSRDFGSNPYVYTTYDRALEFTPPQRKQLNFVLVAPNIGVAAETLAARIRESTGLGAYTLEGMRRLSIGYYMRNTGIPINFGLGLLMTFIVGMTVAGQTFYAFALQNERFMAALKAMGTGSLTLTLMSVTQGLTVGIVSFGIGSGAGCLFGYLTGRGTGKLAFYTPWQLIAISLVVVVVICFLSSLVAVQRVLRLEAAVVFRG
jgi:putative ABC transport system permease protein